MPSGGGSQSVSHPGVDVLNRWEVNVKVSSKEEYYDGCRQLH